MDDVLMDGVGADQAIGAAGGQLPASRHFMAAAIQRCRWLPCAAADLSTDDDGPAEGLPVALALWSSDAKSHMLAIGDVVRQPGGGEMLAFSDRFAAPHDGRFADLATARVGDAVVVATAGAATGRVGVLSMRLPAHPGATAADLQLPEAGGGGAALLAAPWRHRGPAASVDINAVSRALLSVGYDGAIHVAPVDAAVKRVDSNEQQQQQQQQEHVFKKGTGYAGYTQGRWVDSATFVTAGLSGAIELWDVRRGGAAPAAAAPREWSPAATGGAARQLLCLDVHRARPNLCASGGGGGAVAVWDLRMAAAPVVATHSSSSNSGSGGGGGDDVWEVRFDPLGDAPGGAASALPPLLFCTAGGELCRAVGAVGGDAVSGGGKAAGGGGGLACELLLREAASVNSFDARPGGGGELVAVTDSEGLVFAARGDVM